MRSFEVLKRAVEKVGAKRVAADLNVSTSLVYKWCEEGKSHPDDERSGARNPLDRINTLMETTNDVEIIAWLCEQVNGYFVQEMTPSRIDFGHDFINHTQQMVQNFSELLQVMSQSIQNDNVIDAKEAKRIRTEWQELKRYTEAFVLACEKGVFRKEETA